MAAVAEQLDAYRLPAAEVAATLETDLERGLTAAEAAARLRRYGPNELETEPPVPAWRRFLAQFQDVLVILLLIAAAVSLVVWIIERDETLPYESIVIFAIVLLNGVLGYVQEARAERSVEALKAMQAAEASVIRDGRLQRVPARELVPGDLLVLEEGDAISADGRVVQSVALQTLEAALTGESLPVAKDTEPVDAEASLGDRSDMVYSGTAVAQGRGRAIVTATGMATEIGRIAGLLRRTEAEETPLQAELDRTGRRLGVIVLVIAAVMILTITLVEGITTFTGMVDVLLLGVSLAVAAVPEGLPAIVTAVLSIGVTRMARRNAIIRKLPAVETLGSASAICSDKTGTLTKNEMTVRTVVTASGRVELTGSGYAPAGEILHDGRPLTEGPLWTEVRNTLAAGERANNAVLRQADGRWIVQGDPTEGALIVAARKAGLTAEALDARYTRVGEVPFSSERKLMSTVQEDAERQDRFLVITKGAPDVLLARCTHEFVGNDPQPLTEARRAAIRAANERLAREALRTLAMAYRSVPRERLANPARASDDLERELVFLGIVGMIDPPRPEVRDAVAKARRAGIRTIMITGDHPLTAQAIAAELDISRGGRVVTGAELQQMVDLQLQRAAREVAVFARVNPDLMLRIVRALQADGQVVAMTGDGVNDAPALKSADIGVAMGITGTDVSKEAADMVLADDNYATIVAAVEEGRSIFDNIQKFLRYLLSSNIGEVLTMFLGVIFAPLVGLAADQESAIIAPLLATQILWINLLTDGPPALALGLDPADPGVMRRPPRDKRRGVIDRPMWVTIVFVGTIMAIGTLFVLDRALPGGLFDRPGGTLAYGHTMAFTTLMMFQMFNVFNTRSDYDSAFPKIFGNRWLWGAVALSIGLQALVVYFPPLQRAFDTVPLSVADWLECVLVASTVLWLTELLKVFRRRLRREAAAGGAGDGVTR